MVSDVLERTIKENNHSGYIIGGVSISNLSYTDDIAALNDDTERPQSFVSSLAKNANEVGLQINIDKTKCMSTNKDLQPLNICINEQKLKQVQTFDYLGDRLSYNGDDTAVIKHRIGLGWDAFNKTILLLTSK